MVRLDMANSRMKDFTICHALARTRSFEGNRLCAALRATFARRSTVLPRSLPVALTNEFATNPTKLTQWRAFCRKDTRTKAEVPLGEVVGLIGGFLLPPLQALAAQNARTRGDPAALGDRGRREHSRLIADPIQSEASSRNPGGGSLRFCQRRQLSRPLERHFAFSKATRRFKDTTPS